MRERKIITDRSFPTEADINKFKNFDAIKSNHLLAKKILARKIWFGAGAAVTAAAVATAVYVNLAKPDAHVVTKEQNEPVVAAYIQPPIKGMDVAQTEFMLDAKTGGSITYSTGSVLKIPALAFVDDANAVVQDSVKITYREFHTAADIFKAGIPMNFDSAGKHMQLESAGMFEIQAYANGKAVNLAENKRIDVKLASNTAEEKFDVYSLDTTAKSWQYAGKDKVAAPDLTYKFAAKTATSTVAATKPLPALPPEPKMPAKSDDSHYKFKIEFEEKYFPELASFKNLQFEVVDKNFSYKFYKVEWEEMLLSNGQEPGTYVMKLHKEDTTIKVLVQPVLGKADYEKAMKDFEQKHAAYRAEVEKRALNEAKTTSADAGYRLESRATTMAQANRIAGASTYREFAINTLGFHNIDAVISTLMAGINRLRKVNPSELAAQNQTADFSTIYVGIKGKATVLRFPRYAPIQVDSKSENLIWTVTDDGKIAFFDTKIFTDKNGTSTVLPVPIIASDQKGAMDRINSLNS